jgi:hypothetical protein
MADLMNTDVALVAKDHLVAFLGIGLKKIDLKKIIENIFIASTFIYLMNSYENITRYCKKLRQNAHSSSQLIRKYYPK